MKWCADIQTALLAALAEVGQPDLQSKDLRYFVPTDLDEGDFAIHLGRYLRGTGPEARASLATTMQAKLGADYRCTFSGDYLHVQVPLQVLLTAMACDLGQVLPLEGVEPPYALAVPAFEAHPAGQWRSQAVQAALRGLWKAVFRQDISSEMSSDAACPDAAPAEAVQAAEALIARESLELSGLSPAAFARAALQLDMLGMPARAETPASLASSFTGRRPESADFLLGLRRMRQICGAAASLPPAAWNAALTRTGLPALGPENAWRGIARACLGLAAQLPGLVYPGKLPWLVKLLLDNQAAVQPLWQAVRLQDPEAEAATALRQQLLHGRQIFLESLLAACGIQLPAPQNQPSFPQGDEK